MENGGRGNVSKNNERSKKGSLLWYKLFMFADTIDKFLMVGGVVGALGNGLTLPIMTVLFGSLTNAFGQNSPPDVHQQVSKVSVNFVFLGIASGIASFLQVSCWMCTEERQASRIRSLYLETILKQDIAYFDTETSTGEVVGNISGDTALIQDAMGKNVGTFIQLMTTFSGALIVAFIKGWKLTLVLLVVLPIQVFMGVAMGFAIRKTAYKSQEAYGNASTVVDETLGAIRTVASFSGEKKAITDYDSSLKPACKAAVHQGLALGLGLGSFLFVMFCSYSLALWYGSILIIKEGYSGGRVINVVFALLSGGMALGQVSTPLNAFATGQAAAFKLFEVFKRKPVIDPNDPDGIVLEDIQGDVELKQVSFSYPARPDVQIFSDFSLTMPRGTITAIVGESGSGKSTVISLIERFYDPQSGEILIDGIDIKKFQLKWIRQKIALVSQEPVLFATSIKENISYGKEGATLEEIISAAKLANAATFINTMPLGFETLVGEHGAQLSGGQKQRIAIARAILRDPRILLLDEATSALDAESEKVVQEALNTVMVNRTTVIVAHRLTTIRNANSIAVVHRGYIVEKGPHALLIANTVGAYSQLVRLQEMHETSEGKEAKNSNDSSIHQNEQNDAILSENPSLRQPSFKTGGSQHFVDFAGENVILRNDENEKNKPSILTWFSRLKSKRDLEKGKLNTEKSVPISRLAVLNKPEIPILALGSFAAIIAGISLPIHGLLFSSVIYSLFKPPHELRKDIDFWCLMFVVLGISQILMVPIQRYCFAIAGGKLVQRIRVLTFKNVIYQEIGWFDESENSSGAIVARLSTDAANVRSLVGDALSLLVQNIATITAGFVIGFTANWKLTLLLLAFVPFFGLQGWIQMRFLKRVSSDTKVRYEQASQVANEAVGSIRTVASFCAEEKVLKLYNVKCSNALKNGAQKGLIAGVGLGFSNFVMYSAYALLFWVGSRMVKNGETKFGDVFKVFFGMVMAAVAVSNSMGMAPDFGKVKSSVNSIYKVIDKTSKIDASDAHGVVRENLKGEIKFHHVSFRYPSRQNVQIFRDLNIFFPAGKTAALVGESGSGKSTVISLLQRFYNPDSGNILLGGIDISTLQVKWLRQQMGLVGQEPVLFNDTIRSNIAYGKDGIVSDEQIVAAAEASNAHRFISALPQGYDTRVGERGIQLSGGQKQRIAIARAILRDPKVLLLDEATSALDAESERVVQDALDHVKVNRTTIVVAHRLSTIRDADMIAVVKNGVIAEQGKHDELLASKDGTYATLVRLHVSSS